MRIFVQINMPFYTKKSATAQSFFAQGVGTRHLPVLIYATRTLVLNNLVTIFIKLHFLIFVPIRFPLTLISGQLSTKYF